MQAKSRYIVCMEKQADRDERSRRRRARVGGATRAVALQYTVRNVPEHVDRALRRKAGQERKSLNEILRDALIREAGVAEPATRLYTDLDALAGTWVDDPGFDEVLRAQDQIDESLWR